VAPSGVAREGPAHTGTSRVPTALLAWTVIALGWQTASRGLDGVRARLGGCSRSALRRATSVASRGAGCREVAKAHRLRLVGGGLDAERVPVLDVYPEADRVVGGEAVSAVNPAQARWAGSVAIGSSRFRAGRLRVGAFGFRASVQRTAVNGRGSALCRFAVRERVRGFVRLAATVILCSGAEGQGR
jgi:hypothetical protein